MSLGTVCDIGILSAYHQKNLEKRIQILVIENHKRKQKKGEMSHERIEINKKLKKKKLIFLSILWLFIILQFIFLAKRSHIKYLVGVESKILIFIYVPIFF